VAWTVTTHVARPVPTTRRTVARARHKSPPAPTAPFLVLGAGAAWLGVLTFAPAMDAMPGTMGLGVGAFVAAWTLMMAAMMLPSIVPTVESSATHAGPFAAGYLFVWAAVAVPAFGVAWFGGWLAAGDPTVATAFAAALFAACGAYQLSPAKARCLTRCRAALDAPNGARVRDLQLGLRHGASCLGSCWALMALLFAFGLMNMLAMVVLAGAVYVEKVWVRGPSFARIVGIVALALAFAVVLQPGLAPGLQLPVHGPGGGMAPMPGM
jgi:predicted metal-binding membrane protein